MRAGLDHGTHPPRATLRFQAVRWIPLIVSSVAYFIAFQILFPRHGPQIAAFAFVPALAGGFFLGKRAAIGGGLVVVLVQYSVFLPFGGTLQGWLAGGMIANALLLAAAIGAGYVGDVLRTSRGLNRELAESKKLLEAEMQRNMQNLERATRFRNLLDNSYDGVICADAENERVIDVNLAAATMFNIPREHFVGSTLSDIVGPALVRHAAGDRPVPVLLEHSPIHSMGAPRHLEATTRRLAIGDREYFLAVVRDVTERRQADQRLGVAERRYARLVANVKDIVYNLNFDHDGKTEATFASAQVEGITGAPSSAFLADPKLWYDLVHPEDTGVLAAHVAALWAGAEHRQATYRIRNLQTGTYRWLEDSAVADLDESGRVVGMFGVCRDVTTRIEAEKARHDATVRQVEVDRLKAMNRFKTQFLNTAAHELNTPLTPLLLQLDLLRSPRFGSLSPQQVRAIEVVERNIDRLALLVGDMLEAARLESGKLKMEVRAGDLVQIANDAVHAFQAAADQEGVRLSVDAPDALTCTADLRRIAHVLSNMVSNALKFTPTGGWIQVHLSQRDEAVRVTVQDSGPGLNAEQMQRLFQPFSQVHDPMTTTKGGTGLGLYISKGIVEQHGGRIWCESAGAGHGATFGFEIPLRTTREPTHEEEPMEATT